MRRQRLRKGEKLLRGVHPNVGIQAAYRRKLDALTREMSRSYEYWLCAAYRANPPRMAVDDAMPARQLEILLKRMGYHWSRRFNDAAPKLAAYFATKASRRSQEALRKILKDSGISVPMPPMTAELRDILRATVTENVGLIKSIHSQYHTNVEGLVMRSVSSGRDLAQLTKDLQEQFGVTQNRAAFIALDQNNKATSVIQRERQTAVGLERGIWMHSHAGKKPRRTHVANDGKEFSISEGWFDPDPKVRKKIWPGILPWCRCTWRPIVKGFT